MRVGFRVLAAKRDDPAAFLRVVMASSSSVSVGREQRVLLFLDVMVDSASSARNIVLTCLVLRRWGAECMPEPIVGELADGILAARPQGGRALANIGARSMWYRAALVEATRALVRRRVRHMLRKFASPAYSWCA